MTSVLTLPSGEQRPTADVLGPWIKRREAGHRDRRPYERQWMVNQHFAAGKQWLLWSGRDNRVLEIKVDPRGRDAFGRTLQTADVLQQYCDTAIGKLAADDFRPELLLSYDNEERQHYAEQVNLAFGFAWDEEIHGDQVLLDLLRVLVKATGTAAVRCRYDRSCGKKIGDLPVAPASGYQFQDPETQQQHAFKPGELILHPPAARQYMGEARYYGEDTQLHEAREGAICWELLSGWNLLVPPGLWNAADFPWEIVVRPVHLDALKERYGDKAAAVQPASLQALGMIGMESQQYAVGGTGQAPTVSGKLEEHALVYTGYDRLQEETVVFTHDDQLLDYEQGLPYQDEPHGPRSGLSYFHWERLPGRFWAKAYIEPGIGPQKIRNLRLTQQGEIIDRGQPKVFIEEGALRQKPSGLPLEIIELAPGKGIPQVHGGIGPGPWMQADVELQDANVEKALGQHDSTIGQSPAGVSAYSAMALLSENDATKLDVIAQEFRLAIAGLARDTLEAMRQWPPDKQLTLAGEGDAEGRLQVKVFNAKQAIPSSYLVKAAKGGALPRSQAAEVQKIADLYNAAVTSGAVLADPGAWLRWYKESLDAGKAQEIPETPGDEQQEKARLENEIIERAGVPLPVGPMDDPTIHLPIHETDLLALTAAAAEGDQQAAPLAQALQAHIDQHQVQIAEQQAQMVAQAAAAQQQPDGKQAQGDQSYFAQRAVRYENDVQAPRPPSVRA